MENDIYKRAMDHLIFPDDLEQRVLEKAKTRWTFGRIVRKAAMAAAVCTLVLGTALAGAETFGLLRLGTIQADFSDADRMELTETKEVEGVGVHYMKLGNGNYSFRHGMIYNQSGRYYTVSRDYELEEIQMQFYSGTLEKNDRVYTVELEYLMTEKGVVSDRKNILRINDFGEVFVVATDGNSGQWPVYVNLETGAMRDALPEWTAADFQGRVTYAYQLKGGVLVSTIVNDGVVVNGESVSYNALYYITPDGREARIIELPANYKWNCENNTIYCQNQSGQLYAMDDDFSFSMICECETKDDLSDGLLTVRTEQGNLGVFDSLTGQLYEVDGIQVQAGDLDETMGYNAVRYGENGIIAIVQTDLLTEEHRVALVQLGILDYNYAELRMLEIENNYDGYHNGWLDENRLAVVYEDDLEQHLCIYEFEQ